MLDIGSLRDRVDIQVFKEVPDADTGSITTWTTIDTVYANVAAVSGYTTFNSQQINETITHKITIRYRPYTTSENWILMNSRRFRIRNVRNVDERNILMELMCEEVFTASIPFEVSQNKVGDPLRTTLPPEN